VISYARFTLKVAQATKSARGGYNITAAHVFEELAQARRERAFLDIAENLPDESRILRALLRFSRMYCLESQAQQAEMHRLLGLA
jgi:hypothetical protein